MFEQVSRRDWLRWTLVFLVISLAIAYLNRNYIAERSIFTAHHIPLARYLMGEGERAITTYPLWGYALLIAALGSGPLLGFAQALLASASLALFLLVLRGAFPQQRRLAAFTLVLALPWYFLHSVRWPDAPSAALLLTAVLALLYAWETHRIRWAAIAGLMLGMSLNLRPDKVLLPIAIGLALPLARRLGMAGGLGWAGIAVFAGASWALLLPWALHYHSETGHYSLTSSNGGMVAYISLGQLPDNPWGVVHQDSHAGEVLSAADIREPAWSERGNEFLMARFRENVSSDPAAYVRKIIWNLRTMLLAGFYVGDPALPEDEQIQLDVLREKIKLALGVNPNHPEIEEYKERGVWQGLQPSSGALALLGWQLIGGALGAIFLLVALAGMLSAPKRLLAEPLLLLCALVVLYQLALVGALQYQPRHMNGVFVFLVPFFLLAVDRLARLARRAPVRDTPPL